MNDKAAVAALITAGIAILLWGGAEVLKSIRVNRKDIKINAVEIMKSDTRLNAVEEDLRHNKGM